MVFCSGEVSASPGEYLGYLWPMKELKSMKDIVEKNLHAKDCSSTPTYTADEELQENNIIRLIMVTIVLQTISLVMHTSIFRLSKGIISGYSECSSKQNFSVSL